MTTIHASRLHRWAMCGKREHYAALNPPKESEAHTSAAQVVGTLAHAKLEALFDTDKKVPGWDPNDFITWDKITHGRKEADFQSYLIASVAKELLDKLPIASSDWEYSLPPRMVGDVELAGTPDGFLLLEDGTEMLVDLKTGKQAASTVWLQLGAYAVIAERDDGTCPDLAVLHVARGRADVHSLQVRKGEPARAIRATARNLVNAIDESMHGPVDMPLYPNPGLHCASCAYEACPVRAPA